MRPEVTVLRTRDHDSALHRLARLVRDRAGELVRQQPHRRRSLTVCAEQAATDDDASVRLHLRVQALQPVPDAESAGRGQECTALTRGERTAMDGCAALTPMTRTTRRSGIVMSTSVWKLPSFAVACGTG